MRRTTKTTKTTKTSTTSTTKKRRTPKIIRNLHNHFVHLRLFSDKNEQPYRIELQPRGFRGDTHTVPADLIETDTFLAGIDVLFEIITKAEADKIQYGVPAYQSGPPVEVVRDENTIIATAPDLGSDGKPVRTVGPTYVDVPGANVDLHKELRENAALPENAFPTTVKIERVREAESQ